MNLTNDQANLLGWIVIVVILIVFFVFMTKQYRLKYDNIIEFVGGEGSGKTLSAVTLSIRLYLKNRKKYTWKRLFSVLWFWMTKEEKKKKLGHCPALYSNIPVAITYKHHKPIFSRELNPKILTLEQGVEPGSVLLIDELGQVLDQYVNYRSPLIRYNCREFFRLFRQYTQGGYMIATDQVCGDNSKPIRDRINVFYFCYDFHKVFHLGKKLLYKYRIKSFLRLEGSINSNPGSFVEDGSRWKWGFISKKLYDTYCYSDRYTKLQDTIDRKTVWTDFKTNRILEVIPHISPLDDPEDAINKKARIKFLRKKWGNGITGFADPDKKKEGGNDE